MLELYEAGAGTTTRVEDTTNQTVSTRLFSKIEARAKAKANEIVTIVDHQGITQESAPTHERAEAKARGSKEIVAIAVRRAAPQGSAQNAIKEESQNEKKPVTQGKAKDRRLGAKEFGKPTEKNKDIGSGISRGGEPGSIRSVTKETV